MLGDEATDAAEWVDEELQPHLEYLKGVRRSGFAAWGAHEGVGVELRGWTFGLFARVRVFSFSSEDRCFLIVESTYEEDREMVEPGFELIRRTFTLK